jgi:hypothetical protein
MRKKFGLGGGVLTLGGVAKKAVKKIAETAAGRKDQLLELIKKGRAKKLFGSGRLKQKTIRIKDDETGKPGKPIKSEKFIMDVETYDKVLKMPDKKVINNLKAFGFKDK